MYLPLIHGVCIAKQLHVNVIVHIRDTTREHGSDLNDEIINMVILEEVTILLNLKIMAQKVTAAPLYKVC